MKRPKTDPWQRRLIQLARAESRLREAQDLLRQDRDPRADLIADAVDMAQEWTGRLVEDLRAQG